MPKINLYTITGRKTGQLTLPKEIFGVEPNSVLMAQAVRVYLTNQRQGAAKTKTRGEIACSTRKIWRQKGTGRARHGARSAPIFVKGGVAHGPTGEQNYKLSLNKKMRRLALRNALAIRLKDKKIVVLEGLEKIKGKTKEMEKVISNIKYQISPASPSACRGRANIKDNKKEFKVTVILPEIWENVIRAGRNIPYLNFLQAKQLNTYKVLNGGVLIFAKESLGVLKAGFTLKVGEVKQRKILKTKNKKQKTHT